MNDDVHMDQEEMVAAFVMDWLNMDGDLEHMVRGKDFKAPIELGEYLIARACGFVDGAMMVQPSNIPPLSENSLTRTLIVASHSTKFLIELTNPIMLGRRVWDEYEALRRSWQPVLGY